MFQLSTEINDVELKYLSITAISFDNYSTLIQITYVLVFNFFSIFIVEWIYNLNKSVKILYTNDKKNIYIQNGKYLLNIIISLNKYFLTVVKKKNLI